MELNRKNILFLFLNGLVTFAAVLAALWVWSKLNPKGLAPEPGISLPSQSNQNSIAEQPVQALLPPTNANGLASIDGVFGAGNLTVEYILLCNQGSGGLNLQGWQIKGSNNQSFTLPNLTLNANGAVRLYSKAGISSVIELYWGAQEALWTSGERIELYDSNGTLQASFLIP